MINELRKSINSILYERLTSPLYGTFLLSWLVWNWKIIFVSFFERVEDLKMTRFEFISDNLIDDYGTLFLYPVISTVIIIVIFPFATTGAYWITLRFRKWKNDLKNEVENQQMLTIEQSIELRLEIKDQETKLEKLLEDKNSQIESKNVEIESLRNKLVTQDIAPNTSKSNVNESYKTILLEFENIRNNEKMLDGLAEILRSINISTPLSRNVESDLISYFNSHEIIEPAEKGLHRLTKKGVTIEKLYSEDRLK